LDRIRIAARTLRKQPVFTSVVVLSLGLAIALNTTMYGVLDALVHPRTDIRDPDRLYWLQYYGNFKVTTNAERDSAVADGAKAIERTAYYAPWIRGFNGPTLAAGTGNADNGNFVSAGTIAGVGLDFFPLLGGRLIEGRTFVAADRFATPTPIVVNELIAAQLFPGREHFLGESIKAGDSTYTIIGVLSRHTRLPEFGSDAFVLASPPLNGMFVRIARLREDATRGEADQQLDLVSARLAAAAGVGPKDVGLRLHRVNDPEYHYQGFHIALILSVTAVLLVACANVANMQLARGIGRRRELALRSALGADRRKIIGHLLLESVLLAATGLTLGLVLTGWATVGLHAVIPPSVGKLVVEPQWNWRVFASAVVATLACIVVVGVMPSVAVSRVDPNELLKSGAGTGATRRHRRQYGFLVAAEVALALFLLSGAAALVRAAFRFADYMDGYDTKPLATAYEFRRLNEGERRPVSELLLEAVEHARATPGVADAAAITSQPTVGDSVTIADAGGGFRAIPAPLSSAEVVTPGYLRTMDLPLVRGRDFIEGERDVQVAIIDDYTAMSLWPNGNPIGSLIKMGAPHTDVSYVRVIGVFGYRGSEMRHRYEIAELNGMRLGRVLVLPNPRDSVIGGSNVQSTRVLVRAASGDATGLPIALRRAGFAAALTMDDAQGISRNRQTRAFVMKLFIGFAAFGLGLAAFGVYGVVAHSVAERRRELGVRIALGATDRDILHAVLRETVVIGLAGIAVGLFVTKYGVQSLGTFALDEIYNAPLFAGAAAFLFLIAAASAFIPALRATRVDPTESLRNE
jgi:predicted permease